MTCRNDRGGVDRTFVLTVAQGEVSISEQPVEHADARVVGAASAWVAALGPDGDTSSLDISGDRGLAAALLDGFVAAASARAAA
jgi:hypothetical protein